MYKEKLNALKERLRAVGLAEDEQVQELLRELTQAGTRLVFQLKRMEKDKTITFNLLNRTIEELQEKNQQLAEAKQQLEQQSEQLQEQLHKLELSYEELEQFAYIASHDLKSPVRNIHSFAQLLSQRYQDVLPIEGREYLNFIIRSSHHMYGVLEDLLSFSAIEIHRQSFERVDLNQVLNLVRTNLADEIQRTQCTIRSDELPELFGLRSGMVQLFQNLISNAIKFRSEQNPKVTINCQPYENEYWRFTLTDNGVGIDESFQTKIFQPFQRLDVHKPGTGIGLAVCRKVVQLHGGNIGLQPTPPGQGASFYFTLPVNGVPLSKG